MPEENENGENDGGEPKSTGVESMGEWLSNHGYLSDDEGRAVDNPMGAEARRQADSGRHSVVSETSDLFDGAASLGGEGADDREDAAPMARTQNERAVNVAKLDAAGITNSAEAARKAKDLHAARGVNLTPAEREAVDVYRNRYAELEGVDPSIFEGAGVPESHDIRPNTDPRGTPFDRTKRERYDRVSNQRRLVENQENAAAGTDLNRQARLDRLRARERAIEEAANMEELRAAESTLGGGS